MDEKDRINRYLDGVISTTDGKFPKTFDGSAPGEVRDNGQHEAYWILSESERAKGFVRPVRTSYKHVGYERPQYPLRDLTEEEKTRWAPYNYVKYEEYPPELKIGLGRLWTQADLDGGCRTVTHMSLNLAETYARDPSFYGATFCCGCRKHLRVGKDGEFVWMDGDQTTEIRVGT